MATDLRHQQQIIEEQKRQTGKLISDQKTLLHHELTNLEKEISQMQSQKSQVAADLSKLG